MNAHSDIQKRRRRTPIRAPKVYVYARFSTPEQAQGDSLRRQNNAASAWAEKRGLVLDVSLSITDLGVSAYRGTNALDGGLSRFLEACRRGLIEPGSYLLVESLDRISRMPPRRAQRLIDDIVDCGVTIVTLNDDQEYSADRLDNDPTALLIALMVAWRAHEESKTKGRRVAAAWEEKRRRVRENPSERLTCRAPSWLLPRPEGGWMEHPEKTATVRRIFALTLAGVGENKIAATFNAEGVPVLGRAKHWHRSTVAKVLRNPAVRGTLTPGKIEYRDGRRVRVLDDPIHGAFPAVISEADWLAVRALKDGKHRQPRGRHSKAGARHLFAGLAECPKCGSRMTRVTKGSGKRAGAPKLVCTAAKAGAGCVYHSVPIEQVEAAFSRSYGAIFADVPAGERAGELDYESASIRAAIEGREDHLADLARELERTPSVVLTRTIARLEAEIGTLREEARRVEADRQVADGGLAHARLAALLDLLDPEADEEVPCGAINAALQTLFDGVVVDYDAGALVFRWKQGGTSALNYAWPAEAE